MAEHDYVIANDTHSNVRLDLNNAMSAIVTHNSKSSAPATTFANMIYADTSTTPNKYKVRNNGNTTFYNLFTDTGLLCVEDGAVGAPSIGFNSTRTHGLYYGSSTTWSGAVAGVNAFTIGTTLVSWNVDAADRDYSIGATSGGANSFFVQGSDGFIGIGTGAPGTVLEIQKDTASNITNWNNSTASGGPGIAFKKGRGTIASPAALASGDAIGRMFAQGYHTTGTPGYVSCADIRFITDGTESGDTVPTGIQFRVMASGGSLSECARFASNGYLGIGTTAPTYDFSFGGNVTRVLWMERHTTANTAGNGLTILGGGATSAATNKDGGALNLSAGISTGTGTSVVRLLNYTSASSTGTGDNTQVNRAIFGGMKVLTDGVATSVVNLTAAASLGAGATIRYSIEAFDGTDIQMETGFVNVAVVNKAGAWTTSILEQGTSQPALSAGTLTTTWAVTGANPAVVSVNANTSLTPSTGYPRIMFNVENHSMQAIALA